MKARDNPAAFRRGCFGGGMSPKLGGTTAVKPWGYIFSRNNRRSSKIMILYHCRISYPPEDGFVRRIVANMICGNRRFQNFAGACASILLSIPLRPNAKNTAPPLVHIFLKGAGIPIATPQLNSLL
jgi:hypothetical protein